jgi:hypothetical protein
MRKLLICLVTVILSTACGRWGSHSEGAVEQAVKDHLNQNSHLIANSFNTKVESVSFKDDTADALVKFESKQSAGIFVEVRYGLRLENARWQVISSTPMSGQGDDSHMGGGNAPPAGAQPASPPPQPSH